MLRGRQLNCGSAAGSTRNGLALGVGRLRRQSPRPTRTFRAGMGSLLCMLAFCGTSGCGQKDELGLKEVTGTVTYEGGPVEGAIVSFVPKEGKGRSATGTTDENGAFKLGTIAADDGVLPGDYNVTIRKFEVEPSPYQHMTDMEEQKQAAKGPLPIPKPEELLPEKYAKAATSGLEVTVGDDGAKDLNFDLVD